MHRCFLRATAGGCGITNVTIENKDLKKDKKIDINIDIRNDLNINNVGGDLPLHEVHDGVSKQGGEPDQHVPEGS